MSTTAAAFLTRRSWAASPHIILGSVPPKVQAVPRRPYVGANLYPCSGPRARHKGLQDRRRRRGCWSFPGFWRNTRLCYLSAQCGSAHSFWPSLYPALLVFGAGILGYFHAATIHLWTNFRGHLCAVAILIAIAFFSICLQASWSTQQISQAFRLAASPFRACHLTASMSKSRSTSIPSSRCRRQIQCLNHGLFVSLVALAILPAATATIDNTTLSSNFQTRQAASIPLVIKNNCAETIWPALASQAGTGPGVGGFELATNASRSLTVGADWQGRVWGRTNCSFNAAGTGASNLNGNNGAGRSCGTGDCNSVLNCIVTVSQKWLHTGQSNADTLQGDTPVTLAEFDLAGGVNGGQTFYDLSLVDGYNLPMGLTFIPGDVSNLQDIPPNLTNAACIATAGLLGPMSASGTEGGSTNSSFPIPYEQKITESEVAQWCPWNLQVYTPTRPGDGVYPYPDDNIQRPAFDPCLSACASSNSPSDCCTGAYNSPSACTPTLYSRQAKAVCPDAYSYAFDDQTSTFIIPSGGGWEVTFCPTGRSTNILATFGAQLRQLASTGQVSPSVLADAQNITLIQRGGSGTTVSQPGGEARMGSLLALVVMLAWLCVF